MADLGRIMMIAGGGIFLLGLLIMVGSRIPWFGQLPGDIVIQCDNFTLYAPIGTMIVISLLLTLIFNLVGRFWR